MGRYVSLLQRLVAYNEPVNLLGEGSDESQIQPDVQVRRFAAGTKTASAKIMRLSVFEFIRRFLQHVLPTGFMKIRYYGFLNPCSRIPPDLAITLLEAWSGVRATRAQDEKEHGSWPFCPDCNGFIRLLYFVPPRAFAGSGFT